MKEGTPAAADHARAQRPTRRGRADLEGMKVKSKQEHIPINREERREYVQTMGRVIDILDECRCEKLNWVIKIIRPVAVCNDGSVTGIERVADIEPVREGPSWCYEVVMVRRW